MIRSIVTVAVGLALATMTAMLVPALAPVSQAKQTEGHLAVSL